MQNKEYKSIDELIDILKTRGISFNDEIEESKAKDILQFDNYYNVINGYKTPFLDTDNCDEHDKYISGTTFSEIYALCIFDRQVRSIYLKYLLKVENQFKTVISHEFSKKYGHDNYLKIENFETNASTNIKELKIIAKKYDLDFSNDIEKINRYSIGNKVESITKLFGDIQQEIARQMGKQHKVITHYMTTYGYIPLWVLVNVLTFGKITSFFYNMKEKDRLTISKIFGVDSKELHKYMLNLGFARNLCAHDERFYNLKLRRNIHTKNIRNFDLLQIPKDDSGYKHGISDAFSIAIIISTILKQPDINLFISEMESAFDQLQTSLHTISIENIMQIMGFSSHWKNLSQL